MVIVMAKLRDIIILMGLALGGYFILKYIAKAKPVEKPEKTEEQKEIHDIRTQYETEQIKTQPIDLEKKEKEKKAWEEYTETQIACESLYNDFYRDCLAYGGNVVDSETLHMISTSYNVVNERVICDKKYYCVVIYEEEFRRGGRKPEPEPWRRYME